MLMKWFNKDEHGSVMVIVALALTVLLGISGLAVDYGSMALTRQELQNAADAAALAAGQDKANGLGVSTQTATANEYIIANGYTPGDGITTVEVVSVGSTVKVTITTQKAVGFSSVLTGRKTEQVTATAVAEVMNAFQNFPYALFAGETIEDGGTGITGNGNNMIITGNIHSNTDINLKHATVNGVATAVGDITYQGVKDKDNSPAIPMPNANSIVEMVRSTGAYFDGDVTLKNKSGEDFEAFIQEALTKTTVGPNGLNIYVNGNLTMNGNSSSIFENKDYPINLVVTGNISLGGTPLNSHPTTPIVMVSVNGNVEVNGQGTTGGAFYGLIFAPDGDVTLNGGNESKYNGSIYAKNITKNGGGLEVSYNSAVDDHLPIGKVRLIA